MTTIEVGRLVQSIITGNETRGLFVEDLARIALSDDDAETRERRVRDALARFEGEASANPFTAGANPNIVDDNSIVHGGVGGWNR